jgi:hypothetical protein
MPAAHSDWDAFISGGGSPGRACVVPALELPLPDVMVLPEYPLPCI